MPNYKKFIIDTLQEAGSVAKAAFIKPKKITAKKDNSLVTETDLAIDEFVREKIKKNFPEHNIITEENDEIKQGSKFTWICDPIDGTLNFARGLPLFGPMLSLAVDDQTHFAGVFDSMHNELMYGQKGGGAFLNGKKLKQVSDIQLEKAIVVMSGYTSYWNEGEAKLDQVLSKKINIRGSSLSAINETLWVVSGRMHALTFAGAFTWDIAPISCFGPEVGLKVTRKDGQPWKLNDKKRGLVVAPPKLHAELLKIVKSVQS